MMSCSPGCFDVIMSWWHDVMKSWWHVVLILVHHDGMMWWCYDVMMTWYHDVLMTRCHDVMMSWWLEVMVTWCHDIMTSWRHDVMMTCFYTDLRSWKWRVSHSVMILWSYDFMTPWCYGNMMFWSADSEYFGNVLMLWCHDDMISSWHKVLVNYGDILVWYIDVMATWRLGKILYLHMAGYVHLPDSEAFQVRKQSFIWQLKTNVVSIYDTY